MRKKYLTIKKGIDQKRHKAGVTSGFKNCY